MSGKEARERAVNGLMLLLADDGEGPERTDLREDIGAIVDDIIAAARWAPTAHEREVEAIRQGERRSRMRLAEEEGPEKNGTIPPSVDEFVQEVNKVLEDAERRSSAPVRDVPPDPRD